MKRFTPFFIIIIGVLCIVPLVFLSITTQEDREDTLGISIRSPYIDDDGLAFVWHVENKGQEDVSFSADSIAQVKINSTGYFLPTEPVTLQPGEVYELPIDIAAAYIRTNGSNTIEVTASSEDGTEATFRQTVKREADIE